MSVFIGQSKRLKSAQALFNARDTYNIPVFLKETREYFKDSPYLHSPSFSQVVPYDDDDKSEIYEQNESEDEFDPNGFFSLFRIVFRRLLVSISYFVQPKHKTKRTITAQQEICLKEGLRRLFSRKPEKNVENTTVEIVLKDEDRILDELGTLYEKQDEGDVLGSSVKTYIVSTKSGENLFVVELNIDGDEDFDLNNSQFKSVMLNKKFASLLWVVSKESRILLITESEEPDKWSLQEWYRKALSDIALTDSIIIGHPYYWNSAVRRRLNRLVRHFKTLYKTLEERKKEKRGLDSLSVEFLKDENGKREGCYLRKGDSTKIHVTSSETKNEAYEPSASVINDLISRWYHHTGAQVGYVHLDESHRYLNKKEKKGLRDFFKVKSSIESRSGMEINRMLLRTSLSPKLLDLHEVELIPGKSSSALSRLIQFAKFDPLKIEDSSDGNSFSSQNAPWNFNQRSNSKNSSGPNVVESEGGVVGPQLEYYTEPLPISNTTNSGRVTEFSNIEIPPADADSLTLVTTMQPRQLRSKESVPVVCDVLDLEMEGHLMSSPVVQHRTGSGISSQNDLVSRIQKNKSLHSLDLDLNRN